MSFCLTGEVIAARNRISVLKYDDRSKTRSIHIRRLLNYDHFRKKAYLLSFAEREGAERLLAQARTPLSSLPDTTTCPSLLC
jgi:hypothetical protein